MKNNEGTTDSLCRCINGIHTNRDILIRNNVENDRGRKTPVNKGTLDRRASITKARKGEVGLFTYSPADGLDQSERSRTKY